MNNEDAIVLKITSTGALVPNLKDFWVSFAEIYNGRVSYREAIGPSGGSVDVFWYELEGETPRWVIASSDAVGPTIVGAWESFEDVMRPEEVESWEPATEPFAPGTGIPGVQILADFTEIIAPGGGNLGPIAPAQIVAEGGKSVSSRLYFAYDAVGFPTGWYQKLGVSPLLGEVWAKDDAEVSLDVSGLLFGSGATFVQREVGGFIWSLESSTDWEFNSPDVFMISAVNQPDRGSEATPADVSQWLDVINDVDPSADDDGFTVELAGPAAPDQITPPSAYL